ncbi:Fic family protein (plasmid) [Mucilaginibacter robiniae]|jgi:Fic family protein|uniref:Fic family protein n=1 Tax=Mucilaginibacter robiniae TaxID=2728022 RepID=A0A7L5EC53_9SPHI|nr:Fic family protein [Mucilaginibacter robiniae]QJD98523.1 Fic family protein [Mucilaginibacter robiniae]
MDIVKLIERYKALGIADILDHEKFNLISIVHHSTAIEGSTLTEVEAQVLIEEGLTPKGKPMNDSLMVTDHYAALLYTMEQANKKRAVSVPLIQEINSLVIRSTGKIYNTVFGTIDSRTGAFRKGNVSAGSTYFPNYDKVEPLTKAMVAKINELMQKPLKEEEKINLAFDAHYNLVSIHPFYDGNGRTSRLLMNYIQAFYKLPLAIVYNESKADYIQALIDTREKDDIKIFREFMRNEYGNMLKEEIKKLEELEKPKRNRGFTLLF